MKHFLRPLFFALLIATPVMASAQATSGSATRCSVTDTVAFDAFIEGKPTVVEFRAAYSCVSLVLPGDVATFERRLDKSRYFATLDEHGRIVGGRFG